MLTEHDLGIRLRESFADLTDGIEPSPALKRYVADLTAPPRARRRRRSERVRRLLALPAVAVTATLGAIVAFAGTAPSFAVTRTPNGAVIVAIHDLAGVNGANRRLRELGAAVRVVPVKAHCRTRLDSAGLRAGISPGAAVRVSANAVPRGDTAVVVARQVTADTVALTVTTVHGRAPSCVSSDGIA